MSEASNLTPTADPDGGKERRDSIASVKSAASAYSTEPEKVNNESTKDDGHNEDEVCCVSLLSFLPTSLPQICPNLRCIVLLGFIK